MKIPLLKSITGRTLIESHRGAENLAPENSWAALHMGWDSGADIMEVDVQLSQDGIPFLRHHYTLADGRFCSDVPWNELKTLKINDEPIPSLEDVLAWASDEDVCLSLDLKVGFKPENSLMRAVMASLDRTRAWDQVMLISWDHVELLEIKRSHPQATTRALIYGRLTAYSEFLKYTGADAISLTYGIARRSDVDEIHRAGVAVIMGEMWRPDFEMIKNLDVDLVSWGDPSEARKLLSA
jgi:glycerophosphoryl diester phosphodiesterase